MVTVIAVSVFGLRREVDQMMSALREAGRDGHESRGWVSRSDTDPGTGRDNREVLTGLESQWTRTVDGAHTGVTAGSQMWWIVAADDVDPLRSALIAVLDHHTSRRSDPRSRRSDPGSRRSDPGTVPADRVAWSLACHRYSAEH
ncbi:hypothetical protein ABH922_004758 [Rhodococcus sp. 27YEA15]|uniref:hypothetical protein n=1 Tax=Rhodococcus sp. 27YEA15 TaxID=3156259 RepID=UPI003C7A3EA9